MSSSTDNPPVYQEKPSSTKETAAPITTTSRVTTTSCLAGTVHTCSVAERQIDYFSIVRVSDSAYHLSLTVDPTPLYRIELVPEPTKFGNIQIFSMSDPKLPAVAAAYLSNDPKSKALPVGTVCTSSPTEPDASWRPITRAKDLISKLSLGVFYSQIPVVTVPGRAAKSCWFEWLVRDFGGPLELQWHGPPRPCPDYLYHENAGKVANIFATVEIKPDDEETLVAIRAGGGIDFELSVILEMFLILQLQKAKLAKDITFFI